jgi:hypothetical protein
MKKNTFLALTNSKNIDFLNILKTGDDFNYLAKFVDQIFSKIHLDASERAKTLL